MLNDSVTSLTLFLECVVVNLAVGILSYNICCYSMVGAACDIDFTGRWHQKGKKRIANTPTCPS